MADLNVIKNTAKAGGKVHGGFQKEVNDLWMDVLAEIEHNDQLKVRKDVWFTGHSLGAAMATIASTRYAGTEELFTFGSPRVGGPKFVKNIKVKHYRFMNNNDIVCRIPPAWLGFRHHGEMIYFNRLGDLQAKPTWRDMFHGIFNSWKRFKFYLSSPIYLQLLVRRFISGSRLQPSAFGSKNKSIDLWNTLQKSMSLSS